MNNSSNIKQGYPLGFSKKEKHVFKVPKGLNHDIVEAISQHKKEPQWMRDIRHEALDVFLAKPMPTWGANLSKINFDEITYYLSPDDKKYNNWNDIPKEVKETYDAIGIPEAEKKFLAGTQAQYDSEVLYGRLKEKWESKGIIFTDTDTALRKYPELVKEYFGTIIPMRDNKFAALNTAVWSGGSFIYIPKGVTCDLPLQAYFRINAAQMGQFERTLIICEEDSFVNYVEGCSAPIYSKNSLHAAVVEIAVKARARCQYTTIQNWSNNVYNLVTKRMFVEEEGVGSWIDCNLGSCITMKYPSCYLRGRKAKGEVLSLAYADKGQYQDAGGKMFHLAPETSSSIISKSVSLHGGRTAYRGMVVATRGSKQSKSFVKCDALLMDDESRADTYPTNTIQEPDIEMGHEASVGKVGRDQLFYLMSRGLDENQALSLIVNGFVEPIIKELPMEYAVELNRLITLSMKGAVG